MKLTPALIRRRLRSRVIDPELRINVVDLGLVYKIVISDSDSQAKVYIQMTLTTPGCPLAAVFQPLIRQALADIPDIDPYRDVTVELTFDPPWHPGLMSERAKIELGYG